MRFVSINLSVISARLLAHFADLQEHFTTFSNL